MLAGLKISAPKISAPKISAPITRMGRYAPGNMHAVLWDEAVMAPLPRQRVSAMDKRAFSMFNASPHCVWEPMRRLGAAGEWWGGL